MDNIANPQNKTTPWQIVILILSVYVLVALFFEAIIKPADDIQHILDIFDTTICMIFIADFFYSLAHAANKLAFLKWGWIDLISSIPTLGVFRWGRAVRVIRILRLLRGFRSARVITNMVLANRAKSGFAAVTLISLTLVFWTSIAVLHVETDAESNIRSAGDAIWWACTTITTVGYGDRYPVTPEGRFLALILMLAGVGLFGTFSGYVASWFVSVRETDADNKDSLIGNLRDIAERLDRIERLLQSGARK